MTPREERGMMIAATCKLNRNEEGLWLVPSQSGAEKIYRVNLDEKKCTCPDCTEAGFVCKHYYAARFTFTRDFLPNGDIIETKTFSLTAKKVYKQDWRAYNLAQSVEAQPLRVVRGRSPHVSHHASRIGTFRVCAARRRCSPIVFTSSDCGTMANRAAHWHLAERGAYLGAS